MTTYEQFLTAALGITWGGIGLSFAVGRWARSRETEADVPLYRLTQLERTMREAGDKMSDFTGKIQVLTGMVQLLPAQIQLKMQEEFVMRREWTGEERRKL